MRRFVDLGSRDLAVREFAVRAIRLAAIGDHDFVGQVRALFEAVRDSILFVNDPAGTEWVQKPSYTIQVGAGDCDDRAVLLAALLKSVGFPSRFQVAALDPRRPGTFSHVLVMVRLMGRDVALDPTYADNEMGERPPRAYRLAEVHA
jgi:transglutaminase-like putative cysteine protease